MTHLEALKAIAAKFHTMDTSDATPYDRQICKILIDLGLLHVVEYDDGGYTMYEKIEN